MARRGGIVVLVGLAACVGDSSTEPKDGGTDAPADAPQADAAPDVEGDASTAACDPSKPFGVLAALASTINNVSRVGWAQLTHDELSMTYASFNGSTPINLFTATRAATTDPFTTGTHLAIGGANDDDTPSVTGDNLTLYFSSNRPNKGTNFHLWAATRNVPSTDFGSPLQVSSLTSSASEYEPYVSADGTVLYFASNRTGAGQNDLYRATRPTNGSFTLDSPGPFTTINTASDESDPVTSPDELTLYFASNRTGGKGSTDVWKATRADTSSPFGSPTNVGELNSASDDAPSWISDDGCRIYVTRGANGNYAIYMATKPN